MTRLPPFTKLAGEHPSSSELRIYVGSNSQLWDLTRLRNAYGPAIMLPPGDNFSQYTWPIRRREVLMIQIGDYLEQSIPPFCHHLIIEGATIVRVLYSNEGKPDIAIFIPQEVNEDAA